MKDYRLPKLREGTCNAIAYLAKKYGPFEVTQWTRESNFARISMHFRTLWANREEIDWAMKEGHITAFKTTTRASPPTRFHDLPYSCRKCFMATNNYFICPTCQGPTCRVEWLQEHSLMR